MPPVHNTAPSAHKFTDSVQLAKTIWSLLHRMHALVSTTRLLLMGRSVRDAMCGLLDVTPAPQQAHAPLVQMDSQFPEILVSVTKTPEILVEPNILIVLVVAITVQQIVQLASAPATDSLWLQANVPGVCHHLLKTILGTLCIGLHPVTV